MLSNAACALALPTHMVASHPHSDIKSQRQLSKAEFPTAPRCLSQGCGSPLLPLISAFAMTLAMSVKQVIFC